MTPLLIYAAGVLTVLCIARAFRDPWWIALLMALTWPIWVLGALGAWAGSLLRDAWRKRA